MRHSRAPYRIIVLLALTVAGWVVAPVVHQVEHALRMSDVVHHHGADEQEGMQEECSVQEVELHDCAFCHLQLTLTLAPEEAPDHLGGGELREGVVAEQPGKKVLLHRAPRGPPSLI